VDTNDGHIDEPEIVLNEKSDLVGGEILRAEAGELLRQAEMFVVIGWVPDHTGADSGTTKALMFGEDKFLAESAFNLLRSLGKAFREQPPTV
jgi:hypothetical protein